MVLHLKNPTLWRRGKWKACWCLVLAFSEIPKGMSGRGRPVIPLSLKEGEARTLPHGKGQRAGIILGCAEGESQGLIAKRLG